MIKPSKYVLYKGANRKPNRSLYGKHEFHSIGDQIRAEEKSFRKAKLKRKKRKK